MKRQKPLIDSPAPTSELLLDAAGRIFAEQGFHATTVRQITRAAGVNLAAVNYHFRDKQEFYVAVLKHAHQTAARTAQADFAGSPEEQLRTFVRTFLSYLLDPERPAWQGRLIAQELAHPSEALDRVVKESIVPTKQRIQRIVRGIVGPRISEARVRMACFSVIGQCLYYVHCREMITRLFPGQKSASRDIAALANHIFEFSLAGLQKITPRPTAFVRSKKKSS